MPSPLQSLRTGAARFWSWVAARLGRRGSASRDAAFRRREERRLRGMRLSPDFEPLERREVPNDPFGLVSAPLLGSGMALLGASLRSPANVLASGWDGGAALPAVDPAAVPSRLAEALFETPVSDPAALPRLTTPRPEEPAPASTTAPGAPTGEGQVVTRPEAEWGLHGSIDDWLADVGLAINNARQRLAATAGEPAPAAASGSPGGASAASGTHSPVEAVASPAALPAPAPAADLDLATLLAAATSPTGTTATRPAPVAPKAFTPAAPATAPAEAPNPPTITGPTLHTPNASVLSTPDRPLTARLQPDFARQPLIFEANEGQADDTVRFLGQARDHGLTLGPAGLTLSLPGRTDADGGLRHDRLRLEFVGADPSAVLRGEGLLPSRSNYFRGGSDPLQVTDIPNYARVVAHDAYPGIDLVYRSTQAQELEYDFVVRPGADLAAVRVAFHGAEAMHLDERGRLLLDLPGGQVVHEAPVLYQEGPGGHRQAVAGRFTARGDGAFGFAADGYDRSQPLVVDPVLSYATYLGTSATEAAYAAAADLSGNLYLTGYRSQLGNADVLVAKYDPSGVLLYTTYVAGLTYPVVDEGTAIAVDAAGTAYVTGHTGEAPVAAFPTTTGAYDTSHNGGKDAFLFRLSPAGNALMFSTLLGGSGDDVGRSVALTPDGYVVVTGSAASGFPTTGGSYDTSHNGGTDVFVTKFRPDGGSLEFSTFVGGSSDETGYAVAVAPTTGLISVGGATASSAFPTAGSAYDTSHNGGTDAFALALSASGASLSYGTFLGGSGDDAAYGLALDSSGRAYLTGKAATGFPTSGGAFDTSLGGSSDAFVARIDSGALGYSTFVGGSSDETGYAVAVDARTSEAFATGATSSNDFPTASPTQGALSGSSDAFVVRLNAAGSSELFGTYLGGSNAETGYGLALTLEQEIITVGQTTSTNFPTAGNPAQGSNGGGMLGGSDAFLAKYSPDPVVPTFTTISTDSGSSATDEITTDQTLSLSGTASFNSTVTLHRADVGDVGTASANGAGAWTFDYSGTTLAEGSYAFTASGTVGGVTSAWSAPLVVTVDRTGPTVTVSADASTTVVKPYVRVVATDRNGLANGTTVTLDVDLNNDNDFADGGETGHTSGTLTDNVALLNLATALTVSTTVRIRARVTDKAGNEGTSSAQTVAVTSSGSAWTITSALPTTNAMLGSGPLQAGNLSVSHPLDTDLSPGTTVGGSHALVYNSERVDVRPVIQATVQSDNGAALPSTITVQLTWNGNTQDAVPLDTTGLIAGDLLTVAQQVDTAVTTTGRYAWSLDVTMDYDTPITRTLTGTTFVVAEDASVFGGGWSLGGMDKLVDISSSPAGKLRVFGDGNWAFYAASGGGYTSPAGDGGTLAALGGGAGFRYTAPDGSTRDYDSNGKLTKRVSADSQATLTYTYDGSNNLQTIKAPDGSVTTFTYASTFVYDPAKVETIQTGSRTVTLSYDGSGITLEKIANPDGGLRTFTYSSARLTKDEFATLSTTYAYANYALSGWTPSGGGASSITPAGLRGLSAPVGGTLEATVTDGLSRTTRVTLDGKNQPTRIVAPGGGVLLRTYDNGWLKTETDALNRTTTLTRDAAGYVTEEKFPDATTKQYAYQASFHALTTYTDERGGVTTYAYDGSGHRTRETNPLGEATAFSWDSGLLKTVTDALSRVTTFNYDASRRLESVKDALGGLFTATFDSHGNVATTKDPLGRVTTFTNDALGRVKQLTDAAGGLWTATYDGAGLRIAEKDALGRTSSYSYDGRGLLTRQVEAVGSGLERSTLLDYDAIGRLTTLRDANGWTSAAEYDAAGRLRGTTDPLGGKALFDYDLAGQLAYVRNALGQGGGFSYDLRGRPTLTTAVPGVADGLAVSFGGGTDPGITLRSGLGVQDGRGILLAQMAGEYTQMMSAAGSPGTSSGPGQGITLRSGTGVQDGRGILLAQMGGGAGGPLGGPLGGPPSYGGIDPGIVIRGPSGTGVQDGRGILLAQMGGGYTQMMNAAGSPGTSAGPVSYGGIDPGITIRGRGGAGVQDGRGILLGQMGGDYTQMMSAPSSPGTSGGNDPGITIRGRSGTGVQDGRGILLAQMGGGAPAAYGSRPFSVGGPGAATTLDPTLVIRAALAWGQGGPSATYAYDAAGNLTASTDALGRLLTYAYDGLHRPTAFTRAAGTALAQTGTVAYDAAGNLASSTDVLGSRTTFAHDGLNRPTGATKAAGSPAARVLALGYDAAGNVTSKTDWLGVLATYAHDALNRVVAWTDGAGSGAPRSATAAYDAVGNRVSLTDYLGRVKAVTFDAHNRPVAETEASGTGLAQTGTMAYDAVGRAAVSVDALGRATQSGYDALGRLRAGVDGGGKLSRSRPDALGQTRVSLDGLGNKTEASYDGQGHLLRLADAAGGVTSFAYDTVGNQTLKVDARGNRTTFSYDGLNRLTEVQDSLGGLATLAYDAAGNVSAAVDPLGNRTTYSYDALNRPMTVKDASGGVVTLAYDDAGNVVNTVDEKGNTATLAYDDFGRLTKVVDATGGVTSFAYDSRGNRTLTIDPLGNRTTYSYDALNRLVEVKDAAGGLATVVYDVAGQVAARVDGRGNRTSYAYDGSGRLRQVTDALGGLTSYVYDDAGNLSAEVDALGSRTTYAYDKANRPVQKTDALGGLWSTVYDAAGNVLASVDARGSRTTYSYDELNRVIQVQDALGGLWSTVYDAAGNVRASVDALGNRTTFSYDGLNRLVTTKDALGNVGTVVYDAVGNVLAQVDPLGNRTTFSYDVMNRLLQTQDALGGLTTLVYDLAGNVKATIDARGSRVTFSYDGLNRMFARTDPLNHTVTSVYDQASNVVEVIDALGFRTTMTYDALNRPVTVKDPMGGVVTTVYDALGRVLNTVNQLGYATTHAYDALGRETKTVDPLSGVITLLWDAVGNQTGLIDPVGNRTTFVYDALNRKTEEKDPLNESLTYAYDAAGRLTSQTDRLGRRRDDAYDAAGRQTGETWVAVGGGTANRLTFTYDANSNRLTAADQNGAITFTFDALNRVATQRDVWNTLLTFGYDGVGNRTSVQDSFGGVLTSVYDAANRLTSRRFGGSGQTPLRIDLAYTDRDEQLSLTRFSDLAGSTKIGESTYTYDAGGRLTNLQHKDGSGTSLANFTYTYDAAHRVTSEKLNGSAPVSYTYDNTDQLTHDSTKSYSYDANGNRTMAGYQTGTANRISNDGTYTYTYNDEGNLTKRSKGASDQTWEYAYDHRNQLTSVEKRATDGGTLLAKATYAYDVFNRRVQSQEWTAATGTVTTRFAEFDGVVWADLDGANALTMRRVYGDGMDQLVGRISAGGAVTWYLTDRLGSVRNSVDAAGALVGTLAYDGYGLITTNSNPSAVDRYAYTGREWSAVSELQENEARWYGPSWGGWLSEDPILFEAGDANLRRYGGNQPTNVTDPSGLAGSLVSHVSDRVENGFNVVNTGLWQGAQQAWNELPGHLNNLSDLFGITDLFGGQRPRPRPAPPPQPEGPFDLFNSVRPIPGRGGDLIGDVEQMMRPGRQGPPLMAGNLPLYGPDGNMTAGHAMVEAGREIQDAMRWAMAAMSFVPGVGAIVYPFEFLASGVVGDPYGMLFSMLGMVGSIRYARAGYGGVNSRPPSFFARHGSGSRPRPGDLGTTYLGKPVYDKMQWAPMRWIPGLRRVRYPKAHYAIRDWLTGADRAAIVRHEARHLADVARHPRLFDWATSLIPGRGVLRYVIEYRGYAAEAGRSLINPFTPFRSFDLIDFVYLTGEIGIPVGTGIYAWTSSSGEDRGEGVRAK